ncbi:GPP34 family phosphoprotein [Kitasatospora sp. NPDC059571]|uniref:GOLPH3/VPS74 family protein n=1 Tax=Kitasatospora sp. NPDC059571 TaxID=3346871 RepID=UPI0036A7F1AB
MTTPRDLLMVSLDVASDRPVEAGDLSLALAGAELVDLIDVQALTLDGDLIVPGNRWALPDPLLDAASSSLVRQTPYESVEDWLWRRGRGLSSTYTDALESAGAVARERTRWSHAPTGRTAPVDSPDRRRAADRWTSGEPVLAVLAASVGIHGAPAGDSPAIEDDALATVLATVSGAVVELDGVRQRRAVEDAAFDNVWRGV